MLQPNKQFFFNSSSTQARSWTLEQLLNIRGSMWTARLDIPFGPRPNQDSNILAMDYYEFYDNPTRKRMLDKYVGELKLTHAVTGPLVDPGGYHGLYPTSPRVPSVSEFNRYLDYMEEWHERNLIPVHFVHPDGWSLEDMEQLVPLYKTERARKLLPVKVWTGWEPWKYEISNSQWNQFFIQGREVDPDGVQLLHTVADTDAPVGNGDSRPNGEYWCESAKYLDGWLIQNAGYFDPISDRNDPRWQRQFAAFLRNFPAQFDINSTGSIMQRFHNGYAGWPTYSYRGQKPLKVYAGEYGAFPNFWYNYPEQEAKDLGTLALRAGADGVLDGVN
jgi:hypothetical protein